MSRIGKTPLALPQGVSMALDGSTLVCKGPKGTLRQPLADGVTAKVDGSTVTFVCSSDDRHARAMHGTLRAIAANMVGGVTKGYEKKLEIVGVGYKAVLQGKKLSLTVGFANIIEVRYRMASP